MTNNTRKIIISLASKIIKLPQPIHLLAVCSGGKTIALNVYKFLKSKNISVNHFEMWTNTVNGKRTFWKTNFTKNDYKGTAVIVEDVIWKGGAIPPIKKKLKEMNSRKPYVISILDMNKKADFSVFH